MRLIGVHNPTRVRSKGIFLFFLFLFLFYFSILVFWISPFGFSNFWIFLKISHFSYFAPVSPSSPPHLTFQPWESLHFLFYFIFYLQFFFLIQFRFQFFAFWTWIFQNFLFSKSDSDTAPSPPISSFPLHSLYYLWLPRSSSPGSFFLPSFPLALLLPHKLYSTTWFYNTPSHQHSLRITPIPIDLPSQSGCLIDVSSGPLR